MTKDKTARIFDRRVVDRYREKGAVLETDLQAYLKSLPDDANNAQYVQVDLYDAELGEGDGGNNSDSRDTEDSDEEGA